MKKLFLPLALLLMLGQTVMSQKLTLKEEIRANSKGTFPALVMEFPLATADQVKDAWESFIKDYKGKTNFSKKEKEFFTDDATIKEMSENSVDVYAQIDDKAEKGSAIVVWINLGITYLSQKEFPKQFEVASKMMDKFSQRVSSDMLEQKLKEEEKVLKTLESDLKDLEKEEAKRKSDIEDYKATIKKMEENIKKTEEEIKLKAEDQGKKKAEIETQKKKVAEIENDIKKSKK
jgi:hypothetical protein